MTTGEVSGKQRKLRAGTLILLMVANTTKRHILRQLTDGPIGIDEVREEDGSPAELDLDNPNAVGMRITDAGREMLFVSFVLERWLHASPAGPLELGSTRANEAVAALVCGWSSTTVHALAGEPLAFPTLSRRVDHLSHALLEEHVEAMERDSQLRPYPGIEGATRYAVTEWLREAVAPLAAAARLERRTEMEETAPIDRLDVAAAFHLALPLLTPPEGMSGSARLAVELENGDKRPVGVLASVEDGRVTVRDDSPAPGGSPTEPEPCDARATGSALAWLNAVIEGDVTGLRVEGDPELGAALLGGLNDRLFGVPVGDED